MVQKIAGFLSTDQSKVAIMDSAMLTVTKIRGGARSLPPVFHRPANASGAWRFSHLPLSSFPDPVPRYTLGVNPILRRRGYGEGTEGDTSKAEGGLMTTFSGGTLPGEEEASRAFIERHKGLFSKGERLLRLAFSFKSSVTMRRDEVQFYQAIIGLCAKSIKTFRGIHLLCSRGICEDAMAMSRTLLEILTSITHLKAGDRKANAARFWEFMALKQDELGRLFDEVPHAKTDPTVPEDGLRKFIKDIRSRMSEIEIKHWLKGSWHRKGIVSVASDWGLPSAKIPYKFASSAIHASDLLDHIDVNPDGGVVMKCLPSDRWMRLVLITSNLLFIAVLREVDAVCEFGLERELTDIFTELVPETMDFKEEG